MNVTNGVADSAGLPVQRELLELPVLHGLGARGKDT